MTDPDYERIREAMHAAWLFCDGDSVAKANAAIAAMAEAMMPELPTGMCAPMDNSDDRAFVKNVLWFAFDWLRKQSHATQGKG